MSSKVKVGHAEFEVVREPEGRLVLIAGGYGRDPFAAAVLLGDREASMTRLLLSRGVLDIAPIDWLTGEEAPCKHTHSSVRFDGGNRAVVCDACEVIVTHLRPGHP